MESFINTALESALKIKNILDCKDSFLYECYDKGAGGDISIGADLKSEEILIKYLNDFGNIDSEESGFIDNKKEKTIIIDPLDGSDNFISHIPYYGTSIALCNNDLSVEVGIIINFCNAEFVIGNKEGVFKGNLYDKKLHKITPKISKCGIFERVYKDSNTCKLLQKNHIKFRSLGALALSLGLGYEVDFVLFHNDARIYDIKAGFFITKDLHKFENKNFILISKDKKLFDNIVKLLEEGKQ